MQAKIHKLNVRLHCGFIFTLIYTITAAPAFIYLQTPQKTNSAHGSELGNYFNCIGSHVSRKSIYHTLLHHSPALTKKKTTHVQSINIRTVTFLHFCNLHQISHGTAISAHVLFLFIFLRGLPPHTQNIGKPRLIEK